MEKRNTVRNGGSRRTRGWASVLMLGLFEVAATLGAPARKEIELRIETTLPTFQSNRPALAFDGRRDTFFRSGRGADDKDQFTVYFSSALELRRIEVLTGDENGTNRLADGALDLSGDGKEFNAALRQGRFEEGMWQKNTGKTVDELWKEFTDTLRTKEANPDPAKPAGAKPASTN